MAGIIPILLVIVLKLNELNTSIKKQRLAELILKSMIKHSIHFYKRHRLDLKVHMG